MEEYLKVLVFRLDGNSDNTEGCFVILKDLKKFVGLSNLPKFYGKNRYRWQMMDEKNEIHGWIKNKSYVSLKLQDALDYISSRSKEEFSFELKEVFPVCRLLAITSTTAHIKKQIMKERDILTHEQWKDNPENEEELEKRILVQNKFKRIGSDIFCGEEKVIEQVSENLLVREKREKKDNDNERRRRKRKILPNPEIDGEPMFPSLEKRMRVIYPEFIDGVRIIRIGNQRFEYANHNKIDKELWIRVHYIMKAEENEWFAFEQKRRELTEAISESGRKRAEMLTKCYNTKISFSYVGKSYVGFYFRIDERPGKKLLTGNFGMCEYMELEEFEQMESHKKMMWPVSCVSRSLDLEPIRRKMIMEFKITVLRILDDFDLERELATNNLNEHINNPPVKLRHPIIQSFMNLYALRSVEDEERRKKNRELNEIKIQKKLEEDPLFRQKYKEKTRISEQMNRISKEKNKFLNLIKTAKNLETEGKFSKLTLQKRRELLLELQREEREIQEEFEQGTQKQDMDDSTESDENQIIEFD